MNGAVLLLAAAQALAPASKVVIVGGSGETAARAVTELSAKDLEGAHHLWAWGAGVAPRRVAAELGVLSALPKAEQVRVALRRLGDRPPPAGLAVLAAPVEMWDEVPEGLLPAYPVRSDWAAEVPLAAGETWRVRARGGGLASPWRELRLGGAPVRLPLELAAPRSLEVRDADGQPVRKASARLFTTREGLVTSAPPITFFEVRDGLLRLPELPTAPIALVLLARGLAPSLVRDLEQETITLMAGAELTGTLQDGDGRPISGGRVEVEYFLSKEVPWLLVRGAVSDEQGSFSIDGLPLGEAALSVRARGFVPLGRKVQLDATRVALQPLVLHPAVTVPVAVIDESGLPVANARLRVGGGSPSVTDDRGEARLDGIDPHGGGELTASADGFLDRRVPLPSPLPDRLVVRLERAFVVAGRVACDDAPPSGGTLELRRGAQLRLEDLASDGRFELTLVPGQDVSLAVSPRGCTSKVVTIAAGHAGERRDLGVVRCTRGGVVRFQVLGEDGAPATGVHVWTPLPSVGGPLLAWAQGRLAEATSDADGWVELAGLPAGPVLVRGEAREQARFFREVEAPAVGVVELPPVTLEAGREVRVEVTPPDGADTARLDLRGSWLDLDMLEAPVEAGEAVLEHVPTGNATLTLWRGRSAVWQETIEVEPHREPLEISCELKETRVHGRVTAGGAPTSGFLTFRRDAAAVAAVILERRSPGGLRTQQGLGAGPGSATVLIEEDGRFATRDLQPGSWSVSLVSPAGASFPEQSVMVADGEDVELDIDFPGLSVAGRVIDEDGNGLAGAVVKEVHSRVSTPARGDGAFALGGLPAGVAELVARYRDATSEVVQVRLEPGRSPEPVALVIKPGQGREVQVSVRGSGAEAALVLLEQERGGLTLVSADGTGAARFQLQPPYPSRVCAMARVGSGWVFGGWVPTSGSSTAVELVPTCTGGIEVAREGEETVQVGVTTPEGWNLGTALGLFGVRMQAGPGQPLRLGGLPAGIYQVAVGGRSTNAAVRCHDTARVTP